MAYSTKKEAQEAGKKILDLLHEPEGWNLMFVQGHRGHEVYLRKKDWCMTQDPITGKFTIFWDYENPNIENIYDQLTVSQSFEDPNEAIRAQLKLVDSFICEILTARKAFSSEFSDDIGVHTGMVRLFGVKAPQRRFCEVSQISQSTVSTWKKSCLLPPVVRFLFRALLFIKSTGGWGLFLQSIKEGELK